MKTNQLLSGLFACSLFLFIACNGNTEGTTEEASAENAEQTDGKDAAARVAAEEGPQIDPVAWSELQALIPAKAAGMARTNVEEDRSAMGDLGFSHALGIYEKGDKRVEIQIMDSGSRKLILSTLAPWYSQGNIDTMEKTSMEQTTQIKGFPGFEHLDKKDSSGEVSAVINDRFIVMVAGQNITLDELRKVMDGLDLQKIGQF